jgi:hypothetical protein
MDILDFLLAMNLLARIVYDKKIRCNLTYYSYSSDVWIMWWRWRWLYEASRNIINVAKSRKNICERVFKSGYTVNNPNTYNSR